MHVRTLTPFIFLTILAFTPGHAGADELLPLASAGDETRPALSLLQALILGVVEGATEYLPVSSTGHLLIAEHLMGMSDDPRQKEAADSLAICIQAGAIMAVVLLYFGRIQQMLRGILGHDPSGLRLLINLITAFFPAGMLALLLKDWIKQHLFGVLPVSAALLAGGILILIYGLRSTQRTPDGGQEIAEMSWRQALLIGVMQCLAFWPGFSRSLATILGCRWAGLKMTASVEFSFLLGLLTLTAATAYEGLQHGAEIIDHYGIGMPLIALVTAFAAAVVSVRFMVGSLSKYGLSPFGYYRIILAIVCVIWLQH